MSNSESSDARIPNPPLPVGPPIASSSIYGSEYMIPPPSRSVPPQKTHVVPPPNFSVPPPNYPMHYPPSKPTVPYRIPTHPMFSHPPPPPPPSEPHQKTQSYSDDKPHQRKRYTSPPKYYKRELNEREDARHKSRRASPGDRHRAYNAPRNYESHSNLRHNPDRKHYSDQRKREHYSRLPSHEPARSSRRSPFRQASLPHRRNYSPHRDRSPASGQRKRHSPSPKRPAHSIASKQRRSRSRSRPNSRTGSRPNSRTGSRPGSQNAHRLPDEPENQPLLPECEPVAPPSATAQIKSHAETERDRLLNKWRSNFCETPDDIADKLAQLDSELENTCWIRSSPAEIYYNRTTANEVEALPRLDALCNLFEEALVKRSSLALAQQKPYEQPCRKKRHTVCRHRSEKCSSSDSSEEDFDFEDDCPMEELTKKIKHPYRLHPDLWHNDVGEMNDGPLCGCSARSRRSGIRHGIYPGEHRAPPCMANSNNIGKLYHYRITISPPTNFLTKTPTIIKHDEHEFIFEGFSLLSHEPIGELPTCKVIRFNIQYTIMYIEEKAPENFTIRELDLFYNYLFVELLELMDFNLFPVGEENTCPRFHFLPRFVRDLPDNGKEVLAMCEVLRYLLDNSTPLVSKSVLENMAEMSQSAWQDYVDDVKEMVVTYPGMKPCSVRIDQLDRNVADLPECVDPENSQIIHPVIVHFGIRPPQLSYAGNPEYQKSWREYVKFRHLVANMSKPSYEDKRKLENKESRLQDMRTQGRMKRNVTVAISSKGYFRTGIMCDIVQHAMLIPVLTTHLRFHKSLDVLEESIEYKFKNRFLLQLALTHPSYKENFGTNPDHARNSLTNCGIRQPEYGDRKIHYMNTRKRGINTLINIMSRFGKERETDSNITHNERLEFLGDAVVEFLTSIHLFFMFPELEEGGLATYRAAIVQNQHLAVLAKKLHLDEFMLYAHGSDLCHELELRHAMANCFEALMGSLLLDGGIDVADKVFGKALYQEDDRLREIWTNYPPHPLQEQEPLGDRKWIENYQMLKDLTEFEETIGVRFTHIRLLARAFTDRSIGFTNLTLGSNQRLEFLGDTVLQLICSEYLYLHFPEHHEGHLSLLRSSLVNNRTQAVVCEDLGMPKYAVYSNPKAELKTKDRADLLEALLGALYVDKGLTFCETFCHVCLFPRLQIFIMNQDWNDPKSKLQQCCLTLRTMEGGEPDIPVYKVVECIGPTNTRVYTVAVYFRGKRLATATGHSIQQAEMKSAEAALENARELFPQLDHQRRVITQSIKRQKGKEYVSNCNDRDQLMQKQKLRMLDDESNLPKQYRLNEHDDDSIDKVQAVREESSASPRKKRKSKKKKSEKRRRETTPKIAEEVVRKCPSEIIKSATEPRRSPINLMVDGTEDIVSDVSSIESGEID